MPHNRVIDCVAFLNWPVKRWRLHEKRFVGHWLFSFILPFSHFLNFYPDIYWLIWLIPCLIGKSEVEYLLLLFE